MKAAGSRVAAKASAAFPIEDAGVPLYPGNRLLAHSGNLGWSGIYASFATEQPWTAIFRPLAHPCLAYFVNRGATVVAYQVRPPERSSRPPLRPRCRARSVACRLSGTPDVLTLYLLPEMSIGRPGGFGRDPKRVEYVRGLRGHRSVAGAIGLGGCAPCAAARKEAAFTPITWRKAWRSTCCKVIAAESARARRRRPCRFQSSAAWSTTSTWRWMAN